MKKFVMATLALGVLAVTSLGATTHLTMDEPPEPTSIELTDI
ncbi:hypothetical protein [Pontibacillus sp. HMF3514]|nr:hypothetical protein [Pontibacillus sp. HMF3514]